jgi:hypothetical protein
MTDPQEFRSIDDLFRKTFEGLQESPAPNGWDQPSDKVWEQVKTRIQPPHAGWSTQTIAMIAAFAVVLAVGLYWFMARPEQPATPVVPAPAVTVPAPAAPVAAPETTTATIPAVLPTRKPAKAANIRHNRKSSQEITPAVLLPAAPAGHHAAAAPRVKIPAQALPGSKGTAVPNTKVKKYGVVLQYLQPLPAAPSRFQTPTTSRSIESLKIQDPEAQK